MAVIWQYLIGCVQAIDIYRITINTIHELLRARLTIVPPDRLIGTLVIVHAQFQRDLRT